MKKPFKLYEKLVVYIKNKSFAKKIDINNLKINI